MLFNVISDETMEHPLINPNGLIKVFYPFEKAVKESTPDFLKEKISDNVYWCDDLDVFFKNFLHKEFKKYRISIVSTIEIDFDFIIECDNEFICLNDKTIYTLDKRIATYFNESYSLESQLYKFELEIKSKGILSFNFNSLVRLLKRYFNNNYKYYLPIIFNLIKEIPKIYSKELFENIIFAKYLLSEVKIYNFSSDFILKKDIKGRYLQEDYNETLTGRLMQTKNSIQTLSKEKRNLLVAEDNCYLCEFDFDAFEYNIFSDIVGVEKVKDPHTNILNFLELNVDRTIGKQINYSFIYGMSADRIGEIIFENFGITINVSKLKTFPLFKKIFTVEVNDNIIFTYFKRPIKIEKSWASFNNYIQGTAADIFFKKFKEIADLNLKGNNKILLQNHDSLLLQLNEETILNTNIIEDIKNILKKEIGIFSFGISFKYGKSWDTLN